jgi:WD40 repeat protein
VWDIYTFDIIFQKNYNKLTRSLRALRLSNNVLLVFEHDIRMLDSDPKRNSFAEMTEFSMTLNTITYATLNHNEKLLGVATTSAAKPEITLYSTTNGFMKLTQIFGFKSTIRYLDFSTDNYYLQIEDTVGEIILYEIETERPVASDAIDFELEWLDEGLRTQQSVKGIHHQYGTNNKIVKIKKVLGKPIVMIGDSIGTIRMFNYPNVHGEVYYQCYSEHLYQMSDCQFSPDSRFFISACEMDRCVFKWSIRYNDKKILKLATKQKALK